MSASILLGFQPAQADADHVLPGEAGHGSIHSNVLVFSTEHGPLGSTTLPE